MNSKTICILFFIVQFIMFNILPHHSDFFRYSTALGLMDSPIGLAGYILEKFSTWTNPNNRQLRDGGLTKSYTLDDLLTNVHIYWFTGTIGSSMRLYKSALCEDENFQKLDKYVHYIQRRTHMYFKGLRSYQCYWLRGVLWIVPWFVNAPRIEKTLLITNAPVHWW